MEVVFKDGAQQEFLSLEKQLQGFFAKHIEKLKVMPPRRHLRLGIPFHAENITKQARLIYEIRGETIYVIHCFATHKEYERWYERFRVE